MIEIAPSILSADWMRLGEETKAAETGGAALLHVDVMDGRFVPNITIGLPAVRALAGATRLPLDVHLMIVEPSRYTTEFVRAGASMVSVHVEADVHLNRTLASIKEAGAKAGVAINPATPLMALEEALPYADHILLMSVNPGFSGQSYLQTSTDKLRRLRRMIDERGLPTRIEVDGGVDLSNIAEVAAAGADIVIAGNAVFGSGEQHAIRDPAARIKELRDAATIWI